MSHSTTEADADLRTPRREVRLGSALTPERLRERFAARFGSVPRLFRAPGRVNLIGEHTDYNEGFVMPAALDCSAWVAAAPLAGRELRVWSESFPEEEPAVFALDSPAPRRRGHWSDYVVGVAVELMRAGHRLGGANLLVHGEVPLGSGLSSSAALEVASAFALLGLGGAAVDRLAVARLCQRAENDFVGMNCGIMDQYVACFGAAGRALLIDCRSLGARALPLPVGYRLVVCDSMVKHALAGSQYNRRRAECAAGVRVLAARFPAVRALRDAEQRQLDECRAALGEVVYRRCRHVVSENARVLEAAAALESGALERLGALMAASHESLRDDYEVSCGELDHLVAIARALDGVLGARMTGGGFGGCTVNLVAGDKVEACRAAIAGGYRRATGKSPATYVFEASAGAGEEDAART